MFTSFKGFVTLLVKLKNEKTCVCSSPLLKAHEICAFIAYRFHIELFIYRPILFQLTNELIKCGFWTKLLLIKEIFVTLHVILSYYKQNMLWWVSEIKDNHAVSLKVY